MKSLEILLTGDLVLDEPDPDHWLSGIAPALRRADLAIGHLEVPHTHSTHEMPGDVPAPGANPEHLGALARAGLKAVSLAGNHIADCGLQGIADTLGGLSAIGIASCGAGLDQAQACSPAWLHVSERNIALLSYNCVGPESAWAAPNRAGCAYLRILTADGSAAAPAAPFTLPSKEAIQQLEDDVRAVRARADLVLIALHKGIVHTPVRLAPYERPLARAAIEAGADAVIGHHAHILRGIEFHLGRPIFHGLGNGCVVTRALNAKSGNAARAAWARRRRNLFGFEPDPAYELAPFHPQAVNAMLGQLSVSPEGSLTAGFVPVHVEPPGRPILAQGARRHAIAEYISNITIEAGLAPLVLEPTSDGYVCRS